MNTWYQTRHLVKSEDLNHHGTLFAGRMASWFIEGCFVAAASFYGKSENIVCLKLHGMEFKRPVKRGQIVLLETKVALTGNTSFMVYGRAKLDKKDQAIVEGFSTFVCVDLEGKKMLHGLNVFDIEKDILIRAEALRGQSEHIH